MKAILMSFVAALVAFCSSAQDTSLVYKVNADQIEFYTNNSPGYTLVSPTIPITFNLSLDQITCWWNMWKDGKIGDTNQSFSVVASNRLYGAAMSLVQSDFIRFGQQQTPQAVAEIAEEARKVPETSLPGLAAVVKRWSVLTPAARSNILQRIAQ